MVEVTMEKTYRIIIDTPEKKGISKGKIDITEEGALIIWAAYSTLYGYVQTMETRESRGGICWLSEIDYWKNQGVLAKDFNFEDYKV